MSGDADQWRKTARVVRCRIAVAYSIKFLLLFIQTGGSVKEVVQTPAKQGDVFHRHMIPQLYREAVEKR